MTVTRHRRRANNASAYAVAHNDAAPRLVTMAELENMHTDIHGSRIVNQSDCDLLILSCRCVAYAMKAAA